MSREDSPPFSIDAEFGAVLHTAARFFRGKAGKRVASKLRNAAKDELKLLLEYIRSGKPIEGGEREQLALFLSGQYGRRMGRPSLTKEEVNQRTAMKLRYNELREQSRSQEDALVTMAEDYGLTYEHIDNIRKRGWK